MGGYNHGLYSPFRERVVFTSQTRGSYNQYTAEDELALGWVDKGDVLVRFTHPRIGWKPADGTLIIGYHEHPEKVHTIEQLERVLKTNAL